MNLAMPYGLRDSDVTQILTVLEQCHEVDAALLFGSRAKGNYKRGSDVDLAIVGHELSWNLLKDYFQYQGNPNIIAGSRDTTRLAFKAGLIEDGEGWMDMIDNRNLTSHTYNESVAQEIANNIRTRFFGLFVALRDTMQGLYDEN
jgi:nucleotidyltransferase substrate binding protein (TIGR01987 family)